MLDLLIWLISFQSIIWSSNYVNYKPRRASRLLSLINGQIQALFKQSTTRDHWESLGLRQRLRTRIFQGHLHL